MHPFVLYILFCSGDCFDQDQGCKGWIQSCGINEYVNDNCKKTCNLCEFNSKRKTITKQPVKKTKSTTKKPIKKTRAPISSTGDSTSKCVVIFFYAQFVFMLA